MIEKIQRTSLGKQIVMDMAMNIEKQLQFDQNDDRGCFFRSEEGLVVL